MAGCKLDGYVGRLVAVEYFLGCGDVDPRDPNIAWAPIGPMTTKGHNLTWETADVTTDQTVGNLRANLATWQTFEISGSGIATPQDGTRSNLSALTKHIANPAAEFSGQPVAWIRLTYPDLTFIAFMLLTTASRDAPTDQPVTFEFAASATTSDFGLIVLDTPDPTAPDPTSVQLVPATLTLNVGASYDFEGIVLPVGAPQDLAWTSSDTAVATVHPVTGLVTGVAPGSATITAASVVDGDVDATAALTVQAVPTSLTVLPASVSIDELDTEQLVPTVLPAGSPQAVTYLSANPAVATVDGSGLVTGVAAGTTSITVASASQPTVTAVVPVTVTEA